MCADFRVKCEVEVRGLTAPLSLCRIPKARHISGSSQGDICEKLRATLPRALSCRIPFFRAGGQSITVFTTRPDDPRQPLSFVWEEKGEEQAAYEQNARTTWRFRNSYVRLL